MNQRILDAAVELLAVARLRGDDDLPEPHNDPKLWTRRMQEAWSELDAAVGEAAPGSVDAEFACAKQQEKAVFHG